MLPDTSIKQNFYITSEKKNYDKQVGILFLACSILFFGTDCSANTFDSCNEGISDLVIILLSIGILVGLGLGALYLLISYFVSTGSYTKNGFILIVIGFVCFFTLNNFCSAGL